ncbi:MAG: isochorismate synthase [Flavobacteriaceae bacterium]|nr:isochorismate synthase [Flavobacteriaceae bacterium]
MLEALHALTKNKQPFVAFKLPNAKEVNLYYQKDDQLYMTYDFSEAGFLMAPFADTDFYYYIPSTFSHRFDLPSSDSVLRSDLTVLDENKKPFVALVQKALTEFENSDLKKVVVSRVLVVNASDKNSAQTFQNLALLYPTAFVYYWHHPATGSWMGATPERFANLEDNRLHTIALAGTSTANEGQEAEWTSKEMQEQQLVTDAIEVALKTTFPSVQLKISAVESIRAGALWHLKTDVLAESSDLSIAKVVKVLHPTPAVGGVPKDESTAFILENEGYERKFYTGFLGLFEGDSNADFFVNLRCAEITEKGYNVFVGAGITSKSDPINEWKETQRKAKTFCQAL